MEVFYSNPPSIGIAVATYGAVPYIHLQLASWLKFNSNDSHMLIFDDGSDQYEKMINLCQVHSADFRANTCRMDELRGPASGDMSAVIQALLWAKELGLDIVVKLSRRCIPTSPIVADLQKLAMESQYATISNQCTHFNFGFRSECMALRVESWSPYIPKMKRMIADKEIGLPEAAYHNISREIHEKYNCAANVEYQKQHPRLPNVNAYCPWPLLGTSRVEKREGFMWHDSHEPKDYLAECLRQGIDCYKEEDFHLALNDRHFVKGVDKPAEARPGFFSGNGMAVPAGEYIPGCMKIIEPEQVANAIRRVWEMA